MSRRRRSTRFIALLSAIFLLVCQTAFAAQACAHVAAPAVETSMPCHESMDAGSKAPHAPSTSSSCEAANAVPESATPPVVAVMDLPPLVLPRTAIETAVVASLVPAEVHKVCASPPLT